MDDVTAKLNQRKRSFAFTPSDRQALLGILGARGLPIIEDLECTIAEARYFLKELPRLKDVPGQPSLFQRKLATFHSAVQRLLQASVNLRESSPYYFDVLMRGSYRPQTGSVEEWMCRLRRLAEEARQLHDRVKSVEKHPGPQADPYRQTVKMTVARVLLHHGVRLTTTANGTFARCLRLVFGAATGLRLPDDDNLREVLRSLRDSVRLTTPGG